MHPIRKENKKAYNSKVILIPQKNSFKDVNQVSPDEKYFVNTYNTSLFCIQKLVAIPLHKPHTSWMPKRKITVKQWTELGISSKNK